ncbi:SagB/ThcOx family dehydrogenase [bacterium]|nr:SagB/ThcOx family dehydrogenase [candidate division CSSED10-310 bacterium]
MVLLVCAAGIRAAGDSGQVLRLPDPRLGQSSDLIDLLSTRRSIRQFSDRPVSLPDISRMLWAAQGITDPRGFRTAPSAGALYPLEIYLVCGSMARLEAGVYRYDPRNNQLILIRAGDFREDLCIAALKQSAIRQAPLTFVLTAVIERTRKKYGDRAARYVHIEVGHAAQNMFLMAQSLGLGTVPIGAFVDATVKTVVKSDDAVPLYLMPVGNL